MGYNSNKRNALYVRYLLHWREIKSEIKIVECEV